MIQKAFFFFFVIVLAFLPGGIFISVFLLSLYYLVPLFITNNSDEKNISSLEYYKILQRDRYYRFADGETNEIKSYSNDTLEEMK